jgi:hypothetical protein
MAKLLTLGNPKTQKGLKHGYLTAVLHLAPYDASGIANVCPYASAGCIAACLNTAGRGGIFRKGESTNAIQEARKRRTRELFADRKAFAVRLSSEIAALTRTAARMGVKLAVRLNGTSDLRWHKLAPALFSDFPEVQFYDYTKDTARMLDYLAGMLPANYHLTFSLSEANAAQARELHERGAAVAVVTALAPEATASRFTTTTRFRALVDGDAHDLRFLDPKGALVLLTAKGRAKRDASGFVIR